ncbi:hypothetical protein Bca101_069481 [Brassica carinata]
MAYTLFNDLRAGRCSNTAEVRLLRLWEARNINKGGELMSVDMLLIDENCTVVHGSISALRQLRFRPRLTEGFVYTLSGFDVTCSSPKYRLSDAPVSIRFNDGTEFEKLATTTRTIPTEHFRFRPYDQILELANIGKQLPGIIILLFYYGRWLLMSCSNVFPIHNMSNIMGELSAVRSTITDRISGAQCVMLNLRLGSLPSGDTDQSGSSSKVVHAQKIESMTVSELNQFVITADPQIIEFLCTAKVTEIQLDEGWCYIGCSTCSKKLIREETSFTCVSCNETNVVAELKYRVILSVSDDTGAAAFLGFDTEVASLTHVLASDAAQIVGMGTNAQVDIDLPRSLANLVGSTYTFQLRLKDFNFSPNHQTFTIYRIFPARELTPKPTFAQEGGEVTDPALPQSVAPGSDVRAGITNNVADQLTEADGARLEHEAVASGEDAGEETARKKARVE